MFSKEDDISLGKTCKMVPKWGRGSRDPEKRELTRSCAEEGPLAAANAV